MKNSSLTLYLEVSNSNYIFFVGENDQQNNTKIIYKLKAPMKSFEDIKISDFEEVLKVIKQNIYLIEQKINYTFKEIVLILENFNPLFINVSGFKKLNGSQILKENVTYILNNLKSYVNRTELKNTIIHIFNSNFHIDNKKIDNLPIGLFGDFYSHELSFVLIDMNYFKNLENIFFNCNLKMKKILLKSFIEGAHVIDNNQNLETFFYIKINKDNSKIFYFENSSFKYEQNFKFGTDIIIKDISKITSLKIDTVKIILNKTELGKKISEDELIEENLFSGDIYKKIKKKLIYDIAFARLKEISQLMIFKNININFYDKMTKTIFFEFYKEFQLESLKEVYKKVFSENNNHDITFLKNVTNENILKTTNQLVHFGWKKEAIPVSRVKKSRIANFFDKIFS